ncbi:thiamine-phosphate kinase [Arundinibacter roseus]|uniref:Thiamine-monophosphate kinase n=1 Tax=Arundinibacter roseus TaxID=2070510 RepID=A0A4R4KQK9_9BACT|nr:thiamine-phosphate kinase [Arundinibacter roseus]TDB69212.1 thiamine-phosphate kinase [Arundinibacter roseus]
MTQSRTEIASLGEFGLIRRLSENFTPTLPDSVLGIGDDTAVIDLGTEYGLLSTDLLLEGVHFDLAFCPLKHVGYKAIAVNVSDIAAMNGIPGQVTVGLALSNRFSVEAVEELYAGMRAACDDFKVDLVGGDLSASRSGLLISVSVFGKVAKEKVTYRKTAKPNDLLCVTGDLGGAYMGLQVLEREKQVYMANPGMQPELEGNEYIIQRQLKPEARMDVIYELRDAGVVPTAMIDVSDGLASELLHLCSQSGVGALVFEENIPIDEQVYLIGTELNLSPITAAMNGGEDYELLFTIKQADYDRVKNSPNISVIGYMTDKPAEIQLATKGGNRLPITAQGWNHFNQ